MHLFLPGPAFKKIHHTGADASFNEFFFHLYPVFCGHGLLQAFGLDRAIIKTIVRGLPEALVCHGKYFFKVAEAVFDFVLAIHLLSSNSVLNCEINPWAAKLKKPLLLMIICSCKMIPTYFKAKNNFFVISISLFEGVASPEG